MKSRYVVCYRELIASVSHAVVQRVKLGLYDTRQSTKLQKLVVLKLNMTKLALSLVNFVGMLEVCPGADIADIHSTRSFVWLDALMIGRTTCSSWAMQ